MFAMLHHLFTYRGIVGIFTVNSVRPQMHCQNQATDERDTMAHRNFGKERTAQLDFFNAFNNLLLTVAKKNSLPQVRVGDLQLSLTFFATPQWPTAPGGPFSIRTFSSSYEFLGLSGKSMDVALWKSFMSSA